jgi:hypothetical protein
MIFVPADGGMWDGDRRWVWKGKACVNGLGCVGFNDGITNRVRLFNTTTGVSPQCWQEGPLLLLPILIIVNDAR